METWKNYPLYLLQKNFYLKMVKHNPIISEVRKKREQLLAKFDNDLDKLYAHFKESEGKSKETFKNLQQNNKP